MSDPQLRKVVNSVMWARGIFERLRIYILRAKKLRGRTALSFRKCIREVDITHKWDVKTTESCEMCESREQASNRRNKLPKRVVATTSSSICESAGAEVSK